MTKKPTMRLKAGWSNPGNSRKWHYFPTGEGRSLCGRWLFFGEYRQDEYDEHPQNCVACSRLVKRLRTESGASNGGAE